MNSVSDMIAYNTLMHHQNAVLALSGLVATLPSDDEMYPLLRVLSENLTLTFDPLIPLILAEPVNR
jgi:hypothetical protein